MPDDLAGGDVDLLGDPVVDLAVGRTAVGREVIGLGVVDGDQRRALGVRRNSCWSALSPLPARDGRDLLVVLVEDHVLAGAVAGAAGALTDVVGEDRPAPRTAARGSRSPDRAGRSAGRRSACPWLSTISGPCCPGVPGVVIFGATKTSPGAVPGLSCRTVITGGARSWGATVASMPGTAQFGVWPWPGLPPCPGHCHCGWCESWAPATAVPVERPGAAVATSATAAAVSRGLSHRDFQLIRGINASLGDGLEAGSLPGRGPVCMALSDERGGILHKVDQETQLLEVTVPSGRAARLVSAGSSGYSRRRDRTRSHAYPGQLRGQARPQPSRRLAGVAEGDAADAARVPAGGSELG